MNKTHTLPNLNALRGFLAMTVVLLHIPLMTKNLNLPYFNDLPIFNRGYQAVWVFFSLSGFLIIHLLFKEKNKQGFVNVKEFYMRRILRIYPVYYMVLVFGLTYYFYILPKLGIQYQVNYSISEALFWCIAFLPNVFFSLFDPGAILSVLWSIGIEEQFYLLIAPISNLIKTHRFSFVLAAFTVIWFALYFVPAFEFLRAFRMQYFYFTAGGLVAILHAEQKINFLLFNQFGRITVYLLFALYFFTDLLNPVDDVWRHLISVILFPLFILLISTEKKWIIQHKLLHFLGEISYGIYMYHMIALNCVLFVLIKLNLLQMVGPVLFIIIENILVLLLTIVFASFSFYVIEKRFIALKKRTFSKTKQNSQIGKTHTQTFN